MKPEYITHHVGRLSFADLKPSYNISFHNNGKTVGTLDFNGPELVFIGDAEQSAKSFIDWIAEAFKGRLEEERAAERKTCAQICADRAKDFQDLHEKYGYSEDEGAMKGALQCEELIRARNGK